MYWASNLRHLGEHHHWDFCLIRKETATKQNKLKQVEADLGEGSEGQGTCAGQGEQQSRKGNVVSATVHGIICMNV